MGVGSKAAWREAGVTKLLRSDWGRFAKRVGGIGTAVADDVGCRIILQSGTD